MNVQLVRIDDRLIHGQVVIGWANHLNSKKIILCDDSICENDWEKELYLSIVPEEIKAEVVTVKNLAENMMNGNNDFSKTIILVANPQMIEQLIQQNAPLDNINIGGIHYKEGRRRYLPYLYLAQDEIDSFGRLMDKGLTLDCQDVPDAKKIPLQKVLMEKH